MRIRIGTFNIEKLISRNRFGPSARPETAPALSLFDFADKDDRTSAEHSIALALEDDKRQMTALAIAEAGADIWALQEVENLSVLEAFFANYVHRMSDLRYGHFRLEHGNDRGVDVACVIRKDLAPAAAIRTTSHHEATFAEHGVYDEALKAFGIGPQDRVFNRDCLEVEISFADRSLTLFITHLKSMSHGPDDDRRVTAPIRRAEAGAIRNLVERRFGADWRKASWIIAGDLNDYRERILPGAAVEAALPSSIDVLIDDFAVNPALALPPGERWTHFYRAWSAEQGALTEEHLQLDYVLMSPALAAANPQPAITLIRRGLPYRVPLDPAAPDRSIATLATRADRYPRIGWDRPKASDHCPLVIELTIPPASPA
jgi:endonuclease/exonuclease/phosphatase family metal-dependent hydrolase